MLFTVTSLQGGLNSLRLIGLPFLGNCIFIDDFYAFNDDNEFANALKLSTREDLNLK